MYRPEPEWVTKPPTRAQALCKHRRLNKPRTWCLQCGAKRNERGLWDYLTREWYQWYRHGSPRPGERRQAPRYKVNMGGRWMSDHDPLGQKESQKR